MIEYYKTVNNKLLKLDKPEKGCWINVVSPNSNEREYLINNIGILSEFVNASLDEEERPHIDYDDDYNQTLIIFDYPSSDASKDKNNTLVYTTLPLGIVIHDDYIVTICLYENHNIDDIALNNVRGINTQLKTRFTLLLMFRITQRFLIYLRQIDKMSSFTEKRMQRLMHNEEIIQMLGLEKSLVYFSASLNTDQIVLNKLTRGKHIKLYEEDEDLMEDLVIEVKQALDMCNIYKDILSGTMDATSSIISNNLNNVMKSLTVITIVMSIPNIIFGFYGMNVFDLPVPYTWFPTLICLIACGIAIFIFNKSNLFK